MTLSETIPSSAQQETRKRKHPPTFQHLPIQQAKKFKKAWVETAKLKSKWKAEKRKMNSATSGQRPWEIDAGSRSHEEDEEQGDEDEESADQGQDSEDEWKGTGNEVDHEHDTHPEEGVGNRISKISTRGRGGKQKQYSVPPHLSNTGSNLQNPPNKSTESSGSSVQQIHITNPDITKPGHSIRRSKSWKEELDSASHDITGKNGAKGKARNMDANGHEEGANGPTLRDLKREAYSASTLHTFKSNSLHNQAGRGHPRGNRGVAAAPGRGRGRSTPQGLTGGGQPNMKLRMNVMLEKIKRDFANS